MQGCNVPEAIGCLLIRGGRIGHSGRRVISGVGGQTPRPGVAERLGRSGEGSDPLPMRSPCLQSLLAPLEEDRAGCRRRGRARARAAAGRARPDLRLPAARGAGSPPRRLRAGAVRAAAAHRHRLGRPRRRAGQAHSRQEAKSHHGHARRRAAAARPVAALCRVGGALHALAARHGRAHDDGPAQRVRAGQAALRRHRQQGRARAAAHDARPQARARDRRRRARSRQGGAGRGGAVARPA